MRTPPTIPSAIASAPRPAAASARSTGTVSPTVSRSQAARPSRSAWGRSAKRAAPAGVRDQASSVSASRLRAGAPSAEKKRASSRARTAASRVRTAPPLRRQASAARGGTPSVGGFGVQQRVDEPALTPDPGVEVGGAEPLLDDLRPVDAQHSAFEGVAAQVDAEQVIVDSGGDDEHGRVVGPAGRAMALPGVDDPEDRCLVGDLDLQLVRSDPGGELGRRDRVVPPVDEHQPAPTAVRLGLGQPVLQQRFEDAPVDQRGSAHPVPPCDPARRHARRYRRLRRDAPPHTVRISSRSAARVSLHAGPAPRVVSPVRGRPRRSPTMAGAPASRRPKDHRIRSGSPVPRHPEANSAALEAGTPGSQLGRRAVRLRRSASTARLLTLPSTGASRRVNSSSFAASASSSSSRSCPFADAISAFGETAHALQQRPVRGVERPENLGRRVIAAPSTSSETSYAGGGQLLDQRGERRWRTAGRGGRRLSRTDRARGACSPANPDPPRGVPACAGDR